MRSWSRKRGEISPPKVEAMMLGMASALIGVARAPP
jgi:hypothetical protein